MKNKHESPATNETTAQPRFHQRAAEIQAYGTVNHLLPLELEEAVRLEMTAQLNQLLADRLLDARQVIIGQVRKLAHRAGELGDDGTNDLVVSEVLRHNELQAWFLSEHLVDAPLVQAKPVHAK